MRFFSRFLKDYGDAFVSLILLTISVLLKFVFNEAFPPSYDEAAYSICAKNIADNGGWFNLYNSTDLFFFPPLFNWLGAILIKAGMEQLSAVRTVSMVFSSGIPVMIYLLMSGAGTGLKSSLAAAVTWIIIPGSIFFGITGQAETSFIFFSLLSIWLFTISNGKYLNIVLSALSLSIAVWFKETAIGFVPVFLILILLKKEFRLCAVWFSALILFISPLLFQTFLLHHYDLFYELSNDLLNWNSVSVVFPFSNLASIAGAGVSDSAAFAAFFITAVSSVIVFLKRRDSFIVRYTLLSNIVFIIFFIIFPKKFEYYMLPSMIFSLMTLFIAVSKRTAAVVFSVIFFSAVSVSGLGLRLSGWSSYSDIQNFLKLVEISTKGAVIGTPTPHIQKYIVSSQNMNISIYPLDFFAGSDPDNCRERKDRCILKNDYFLSDDEFFTVLFCKNWPVETENCDLEAMKTVIRKMEKIEKRSGFTLYKVLERSR